MSEAGNRHLEIRIQKYTIPAFNVYYFTIIFECFAFIVIPCSFHNKLSGLKSWRQTLCVAPILLCLCSGSVCKFGQRSFSLSLIKANCLKGQDAKPLT
jgi:hypothetical protein